MLAETMRRGARVVRGLPRNATTIRNFVREQRFAEFNRTAEQPCARQKFSAQESWHTPTQNFA
jgi:hypothetical protein